MLHRATIVGGVLASVADNSMLRFEQAHIRELNPDGLSPTVWDIADELGWAKTYDAEYLALARCSMRRCSRSTAACTRRRARRHRDREI